MIVIKQMSVDSQEAVFMMEELSEQLKTITGSDGKSSFKRDEWNANEDIFAVAFEDNKAVGCGGIRKLSDCTAELKRMYAKEKKKGIGSALLAFLEKEAKKSGYEEIRLETRRINENAVQFYLKKGYHVCENFGRYKGKEEAVCFFKML